MRRLLGAAVGKASRFAALGGLLPELTLLARLVRAYARGEYRQVPRRTLALGAFTAAYLLTPIDLIPDFIPVLGFLDDVAVVGLVLRRISGDLERFRAWEESRPRSGAPSPGASSA